MCQFLVTLVEAFANASADCETLASRVCLPRDHLRSLSGCWRRYERGVDAEIVAYAKRAPKASPIDNMLCGHGMRGLLAALRTFPVHQCEFASVACVRR
jgi:hypothetical protein